MDGKVGSLQILPDQIQVVNAFLILVFIPIFDKGVYPLFGKPTQRVEACSVS